MCAGSAGVRSSSCSVRYKCSPTGCGRRYRIGDHRYERRVPLPRTQRNVRSSSPIGEFGRQIYNYRYDIRYVTVILALTDVFARFGSFLEVTVLVGFFAASLVAFVFRNREGVRRSYVVFFLLILVVTNVTGLEPIPFRDVHEYTSVSSEQRIHYDVRVVGADGRELPYDPHAVPPALAIGSVGENMVAPDTRVEYTASQRREMARFLLRNAREYRRRTVAGRDPLSVLAFPPHYLRDHWTAEELDELSKFVALRVYWVEVTFTKDGQRVRTDEELAYEYRPGSNGTS